jgi:FAD:protein FMN transferase
VDALFSTFRPDSEISRLNRGELDVRRSHPLVREVIGLCAEARRRTDGYFDARRPGFRGGWYDPSGLVKGWAVERAGALLAARLPGHDWYVNAGGDVALHVADPDRPAWRVGIEDPRDRTRVLGVLALRSGGVATSGLAARGAHIVDPHTGRPATAVVAATVVGPSLRWADVCATAAVARGRDAAGWLATQGVEGLLVTSDGERLRTPGLRVEAPDRPVR